MKLSDFNKKPKLTKKASPIVINNDEAERKYKEQINNLNAQLSYYKKIEGERDNAVSKTNAVQDTLKSERFLADQNKELINQLEQEKNNLLQITEKIPELEENLRAAKGLAGSKESEVDTLLNKAMKQSQEISLLKSQLDTTNQENVELSKNAKEAISRKQSTDADFEAISNKNKEMKSFTDETSKINKELIEDNKTLRDWANYKDVENKELLVQLEDLKTVETKLREWMNKMETKDSQTTSSKTSLENKVSTQQKVITDMSKTLDDVMKEMAYVTKLNREYRKELAKPTYTSMSAIASQEGFVMPNGKENLRTHNLGNYKTTMLKFKKKEEIKNGR